MFEVEICIAFEPALMLKSVTSLRYLEFRGTSKEMRIRKQNNHLDNSGAAVVVVMESRAKKMKISTYVRYH